MQILKKIRSKDANLNNEIDAMKAALAEDAKQVSGSCDYYWFKISIDNTDWKLNFEVFVDDTVLLIGEWKRIPELAY